MQSDANRCNDIQSDKIRCVQRQAKAISGNHLLLGEQAIGQCDEIVLVRAQSALVPPDAPGHRCRALRQASAIRCHIRCHNQVPHQVRSPLNRVHSGAILVQSGAKSHAPKVLDDPRHASARDLVAGAEGATRCDDESLDNVGERGLAREADDNGRKASEG